MTPIFHLRNYA